MCSKSGNALLTAPISLRTAENHKPAASPGSILQQFRRTGAARIFISRDDIRLTPRKAKGWVII